MQHFASYPHTASTAYVDKKCRLNGAALPRAASPLPLAHLNTLQHRGFSPHTRPTLQRSPAPSAPSPGFPLALKHPRPEGAPPPPAPPKGRRDKTQTPPEGRRRPHGPGVFGPPQTRRESRSTAAATRQGPPPCCTALPAEPAVGAREGERGPSMPGRAQGPGGRRSSSPTSAAATRKRKEPPANCPPPTGHPEESPAPRQSDQSRPRRGRD